MGATWSIQRLTAEPLVTSRSPAAWSRTDGLEEIATGAVVADARADDIAQWLWAAVHGVVSLELTGALEVDAATYDTYLTLSLAGYLISTAH